jgi:hypothetical protein
MRSPPLDYLILLNPDTRIRSGALRASPKTTNKASLPQPREMTDRLNLRLPDA